MRFTQRGFRKSTAWVQENRGRETGRRKCFGRCPASTFFPGANCQQRDPFSPAPGLMHRKSVSAQGRDQASLLGTQNPGKNQTTVTCQRSLPDRQRRRQNFAEEIRRDE